MQADCTANIFERFMTEYRGNNTIYFNISGGTYKYPNILRNCIFGGSDVLAQIQFNLDSDTIVYGMRGDVFDVPGEYIMGTGVWEDQTYTIAKKSYNITHKLWQEPKHVNLMWKENMPELWYVTWDSTTIRIWVDSAGNGADAAYDFSLYATTNGRTGW